MFTPSKYNEFAQSNERAAYRDAVPLKMSPYKTVTLGKDLLWQLKASRDHRIYSQHENRGLNSTTTQDALTVPTGAESTVMDDGSVVCGDPVSFPFLKGMGSLHHRLQHTKAQLESPAKVFAKMKSKVQRGATCVKEGIHTEKDMLFRVREQHGAEFKSPSKGKENTWTADKTKENQRLHFDHDEAEALTLSPTPSPRKSLSYRFSDLSSKPLQEISPMKDIGNSFKPRNGYTPTKRPVLEPTAGSHPLTVVNTKQIQRPSPLISNVDVFKMTNRTPVKVSTEDDFARNAFGEACVSLDRRPLMSPAKMFAHMKERERKRKWEQQEFVQVSSRTREFNNGGHICPPQERPTSTAFDEDETHNDTSVAVFGRVPGSVFPANQSEMNPYGPGATDNRSETDPNDGMPPPAVKRRPVLAQEPLLHDSPWTSVSKKRHSYQCQDSPTSTTMDKGEMEDNTCMDAFFSVPGSALPVSRSRSEAADSQSDVDPSGVFLLPAVKSQPALVEDPLVFNSPRISIPKKREAVFKQKQFPNVNVIYLKKWLLRFNSNGLYVDGIRREDNMPWHSNIIVERVSNCELKTVSGRVYMLVGKMDVEVVSELPRWLLRKFVYGFPPKWKMYYEKFLSESRDSSMEAGRNSEGRSTKAWPVSEKPATTLSVKRHRQKPLKTSASCLPTLSCSVLGGTRVSRSGRVIKPPLEYWKGGRVTLDADMNVTIHETYDTTTCKPQVTTPASTRLSQQPARVFLPHSEGHRQGELPSNSNESSVPLRKVKTSHRKRNRDKANPDKKSSNQTELSSSEESNRNTRSGPRCPARETTLYTDGVPQSGLQPNQYSPLRSKKQNRLHDASSVRALVSKLTVPAPTEPPTGNDTASQSEDEFSVERKKKGKGAHRRRDQKVLDESPPSHLSPPCRTSSSSEDSGRVLRKRTAVSAKSDAAQKSKVHKQNKCSETSPPPKPVPKLIQSSKKRSKGHKSVSSNKVIQQEKDEDRWTEAELVKLQEAVSSFPKHMGSYWVNVAMMVGTRSAEECQKQHTSQGTFQVPSNRAKKSNKEETTKDPDPPTISARVGTLKRKQQVRQFLDAMPKEDHDDVFSSASMQSKRFQLPSMTPSGKDHGFMFSDQDPMTPMSAGFPAVKTPQCLHITPGMMGSPNRSNDDKYIYQLQKRMKKNQFNVYKHGPAKNYTPTPSVKRAMRRCGNTENDTFVVWEMFPDKDGGLAESGEEEDFYFSDND
ncbi:mis18-binding protein 1 isoform X1 [Centroberyx affinis]|uniref:mis18-binding protein 1 isoform X1 n=1 Tax=Centroberyx affinis TaxID=166261 RepID=UPI003A5C0E25